MACLFSARMPLCLPPRRTFVPACKHQTKFCVAGGAKSRCHRVLTLKSKTMKVLKSIKSWFNAISRWFMNLMTINDKFVHTYAPVAVETMNMIKRANDEGVIINVGTFASVLGVRWGSDVAQKVSAWLTDNVDRMIYTLDIMQQAADCKSIDEKLLVVSRAISRDFPEIRERFCTIFAAELSRDLADGHLSLSEAISLITGVYKTYYGNKKSSKK
jgi:hypothetical protein